MEWSVTSLLSIDIDLTRFDEFPLLILPLCTGLVRDQVTTYRHWSLLFFTCINWTGQGPGVPLWFFSENNRLQLQIKKKHNISIQKHTISKEESFYKCTINVHRMYIIHKTELFSARVYNHHWITLPWRMSVFKVEKLQLPVLGWHGQPSSHRHWSLHPSPW